MVEHDGDPMQEDAASPVKSTSPFEAIQKKTARQANKEEREKNAEIEGQLKREEKERLIKEMDQQDEASPFSFFSFCKEKSFLDTLKKIITIIIIIITSQLERCEEAVGVRPLGQDRQYRLYWWFPSLPALLIEEVPEEEEESEKVGAPEFTFVTSQVSLDQLLDSLEYRLPRERALKQALKARRHDILGSFEEISYWLATRAEGVKEVEAEELSKEVWASWEDRNVVKGRQKLFQLHSHLVTEDVLMENSDEKQGSRRQVPSSFFLSFLISFFHFLSFSE